MFYLVLESSKMPARLFPAVGRGGSPSMSGGAFDSPRFFDSFPRRFFVEEECVLLRRGVARDGAAARRLIKLNVDDE